MNAKHSSGPLRRSDVSPFAIITLGLLSLAIIQFIFVLAKPVGAPQGAAQGLLGLVVDGLDLGTIPYSF